jgi:ABC-type Na+ transport system ATPase subunit NatA
VLTENAGLDDRLTARENVAFTAQMRGLTRSDSAEPNDDAAGAIRSAERADHPVQGMSTG